MSTNQTAALRIARELYGITGKDAAYVIRGINLFDAGTDVFELIDAKRSAANAYEKYVAKMAMYGFNAAMEIAHPTEHLEDDMEAVVSSPARLA